MNAFPGTVQTSSGTMDLSADNQDMNMVGMSTSCTMHMPFATMNMSPGSLILGISRTQVREGVDWEMALHRKEVPEG